MPTPLPMPSTVVGLGNAQVDITIDFNRIIREFTLAAIGEVNRATTQAYAIAQEKDPVRRVFQERRKKPRPLGQAEREALFRATEQIEGGYMPSLSVQTRRGGANQFFPYLRRPTGLNQSMRKVEWGSRVRGDFRRVSYDEKAQAFRLEDPFAHMQLTGRGRAELRRKEQQLSVFDQAKFLAGRSKGTTALSKNPASIYEGRLGGRLKGEMYVQRAQPEDNGFAGYVVSPTPYAKYVEFGTRYAAAQPYLRPALDTIETRYHDDMVRALQRAGRVALQAGKDLPFSGRVDLSPEGNVASSFRAAIAREFGSDYAED